MTTSWFWAYVPSRSISKAMKHILKLNGIVCHYLLPWKGILCRFFFSILCGKVTFELLTCNVIIAIVSIIDFFFQKYNLLKIETVVKSFHVKIGDDMLYQVSILLQVSLAAWTCPPNPTNCLFLSMLQWSQLRKSKYEKSRKKKNQTILTFLKYELLILLVHLGFVQLSTESIKTFCSTIRIVILRPNYLHNWNLEVLMNSRVYNAVHHKYGQEQFRGLYYFL